MKYKLFISHASEDKEAFVQPLVERLMADPDFEVWYDKYSLVLGDSLRRKIDQGLAECDYGVVVLSAAFFSKEWPQLELDGLVALEPQRGKLILPIWKDLTASEVARFSPILAGRMGARTSQGMDSVIDQIKIAVDSGSRVAAFSGFDALKSRFQNLDRTHADQQAAKQLAGSEEGVELVRQAVVSVFDQLQQGFEHLKEGNQVFQFRIERAGDVHLNVWAPFNIGLHLNFRFTFSNSINRSSFDIFMGQYKSPYFPGEPPHQLMHSERFSPEFEAREVVWRLNDRVLTGKALVEYTAKVLIDRIEEFVSETQKTVKL